MAPLYDSGRTSVLSRTLLQAETEVRDHSHVLVLCPGWDTERLLQNLQACLITMHDELEDIGVLLDLLYRPDPLGRERQVSASPTLEVARQAYARLVPCIKQELIGRLVLVVRENMTEPGEPAHNRLPVPV